MSQKGLSVISFCANYRVYVIPPPGFLSQGEKKIIKVWGILVSVGHFLTLFVSASWRGIVITN